ncbi:hypothetical protein Nepgr_005791 [Nepenthes gracilis]|uniref:Uncharacterized protein n=1 Tax=Nepenthes gracilis TaxID=150966 RepID=A0AAD3S3U9_NEPGR|nr:hypothetical protein Nepgr_005791 [Nepenthes gracilis]
MADFAATLLSFNPRFSLLRTADPTLESTDNLTALNRNVQGNQILKQIGVFCWPQSHRLSILRKISGLFSRKIPAIGAVAG